MSKMEETCIIIGLVLAILGCIAAWLAVPQVQMYLNNATVTDIPAVALSTATMLPLTQPSPSTAKEVWGFDDNLVSGLQTERGHWYITI